MLVIMEGKRWSKPEFSGRHKNLETFFIEEEKYVAFSINQVGHRKHTSAFFIHLKTLFFFELKMWFFLPLVYIYVTFF